MKKIYNFMYVEKACEVLRNNIKEWQREVVYTGRSKRWNKDLIALRKKGRKNKEARKISENSYQKEGRAKLEWIPEGKDVWPYTRLVRNYVRYVGLMAKKSVKTQIKGGHLWTPGRYKKIVVFLWRLMGRT